MRIFRRTPRRTRDLRWRMRQWLISLPYLGPGFLALDSILVSAPVMLGFQFVFNLLLIALGTQIGWIYYMYSLFY